ncbi:glycerophosphodiester phosphodiesterase family protein [Francisella philomiragia]|uniref:Glycerophosphoryl diester phosphodiesterase family protein n=1 Tax=Francisella philomiragia TaxID=28110 RepID=A0A0B6CQ35_9GAMM|nr:glycerophosphodiester phosphodiesterase family protein [Francisella philomiragia]AJI52589.1 glycerophosphoryl diester phosphodiesterase family protein [Francisella philomiragia]
MHIDKYISHRGANSDAVENTMEAFQIAKKAGFKWFETDVQMSSDGELFLFHDDTPQRFSSISENVTNMSWSELNAIELIHPVVKSKAKVLTLKEYLEWAEHNNAFLNLEIKVSNEDINYQKTLVAKVIELLEHYPTMKSKILLSSFSKVVMRELRRHKDFTQGKLFYTTNWVRDFEYIDSDLYKDFVKNKYIAIIINYSCLTHSRVKYLKRKFGRVFVYSVYTDDEIKQLLEWQIDAIFIDKKEQLNLSI